jgi:hypothetical protein
MGHLVNPILFRLGFCRNWSVVTSFDPLSYVTGSPRFLNPIVNVVDVFARWLTFSIQSIGIFKGAWSRAGYFFSSTSATILLYGRSPLFSTKWLARFYEVLVSFILAIKKLKLKTGRLVKNLSDNPKNSKSLLTVRRGSILEHYLNSFLGSVFKIHCGGDFDKLSNNRNVAFLCRLLFQSISFLILGRLQRYLREFFEYCFHSLTSTVFYNLLVPSKSFLKIHFLPLIKRSLTPLLVSRYLVFQGLQLAPVPSTVNFVTQDLSNAIGGALYGYKLKYTGRHTRQLRARKFLKHEGSAPLSTLDAHLGFSQSVSVSRFGALSFKLWLHHSIGFRSEERVYNNFGFGVNYLLSPWSARWSFRQNRFLNYINWFYEDFKKYKRLIFCLQRHRYIYFNSDHTAFEYFKSMRPRELCDSMVDRFVPGLFEKNLIPLFRFSRLKNRNFSKNPSTYFNFSLKTKRSGFLLRSNRSSKIKASVSRYLIKSSLISSNILKSFRFFDFKLVTSVFKLFFIRSYFNFHKIKNVKRWSRTVLPVRAKLLNRLVLKYLCFQILFDSKKLDLTKIKNILTYKYILRSNPLLRKRRRNCLRYSGLGFGLGRVLFDLDQFRFRRNKRSIRPDLTRRNFKTEYNRTLKMMSENQTFALNRSSGDLEKLVTVSDKIFKESKSVCSLNSFSSPRTKIIGLRSNLVLKFLVMTLNRI